MILDKIKFPKVRYKMKMCDNVCYTKAMLKKLFDKYTSNNELQTNYDLSTFIKTEISENQHKRLVYKLNSILMKYCRTTFYKELTPYLAIGYSYPDELGLNGVEYINICKYIWTHYYMDPYKTAYKITPEIAFKLLHQNNVMCHYKIIVVSKEINQVLRNWLNRQRGLYVVYMNKTYEKIYIPMYDYYDN